MAEIAVLANDLVRLAVEAGARGDDVTWVSEIIDDWCPTGRPIKFPRPLPDWDDLLGPHPDPWRLDLGRVTGAMILGLAGARLDGDVGVVLSRGADQLLESASFAQG